jgi:hypothetical protein
VFVSAWWRLFFKFIVVLPMQVRLQAFQEANGIVPDVETDPKEGQAKKNKTLKQPSIRDLFGGTAAATVCVVRCFFLIIKNRVFLNKKIGSGQDASKDDFAAAAAVASAKPRPEKTPEQLAKAAAAAEAKRQKHELKFMSAAERQRKKEQLKEEKRLEREKYDQFCVYIN